MQNPGTVRVAYLGTWIVGLSADHAPTRGVLFVDLLLSLDSRVMV